MSDNIELERLVEKYGRMLGKYCLKRLDYDEKLSKEVVSDVWYVIIRKKKEINFGGGIKKYLFKVADKCILRSRSEREKKRQRELPYGEAYSAIDREKNYCDIYFGDERGDDELLLVAMEKLPEDQRELFRLRFIEKMTLQEISVKTGIPVSTVGFRLEKIKSQIRKIAKELLIF